MKSFGKKIISALNKVINYVIVAILLASLFIGLYAVWDTKIVHTQASSAHWTPYKPTLVEKLSYEELVEINPDVKAWITLYGTGIDYPVCYSKEQNYYLFRDAKGQRSIIGSIFFDSNCAPDFSHWNTILYGHHMEAHAMFGDIDLFADEDFFNSHHYGNLFFNEQNHGLIIMGYIKTNAHDSRIYRTNIQSASAQDNYMSYLEENAKYWRTSEYFPDDKLVLLSTCSSDATEGRSILVCSLTDQTFENTFTEEINTGPGVDDLKGIFGFPWTRWVIGFIVVVMLVAFTLYQIDKKQFRR